MDTKEKASQEQFLQTCLQDPTFHSALCVLNKDLRSGEALSFFSAEGQPVESLLTACWPDSSINTSCDYYAET